MKTKERKNMIKLYWEWKLKHTSIQKIMQRENLSVYFLNEMFGKLDKEFELENWTAKYY